MNCPHCAQPVPRDAVFCQNCGGALLPSGSLGPPATLPYDAPPTYASPGAPPPNSSGNRTLIIVLAVIVAALVLMTGVAAAFLITRRSESTTSSSLTVITEAPHYHGRCRDHRANRGLNDYH